MMHKLRLITCNLSLINEFLDVGIEAWIMLLSWDDTYRLQDFQCSRLTTLCMTPPEYNNSITLLIILTNLHHL